MRTPEQRIAQIKIDACRLQPDGDLFLLTQVDDDGYEMFFLYFRLCDLTKATDGVLVSYVGNLTIPYSLERLSAVTGCTPQLVQKALAVFTSMGLLFKNARGFYEITGSSDVLGSETASARRMRQKRELEAIKAEEFFLHDEDEQGDLFEDCANNVRTMCEQNVPICANNVRTNCEHDEKPAENSEQSVQKTDFTPIEDNINNNLNNININNPSIHPYLPLKAENTADGRTEEYLSPVAGLTSKQFDSLVAEFGGNKEFVLEYGLALRADEDSGKIERSSNFYSRLRKRLRNLWETGIGHEKDSRKIEENERLKRDSSNEPLTYCPHCHQKLVNGTCPSCRLVFSGKVGNYTESPMASETVKQERIAVLDDFLGKFSKKKKDFKPPLREAVNN